VLNLGWVKHDDKSCPHFAANLVTPNLAADKVMDTIHRIIWAEFQIVKKAVLLSCALFTKRASLTMKTRPKQEINKLYTFLAIFWPWPSVGIRTLHLKNMSRVFYHCAVLTQPTNFIKYLFILKHPKTKCGNHFCRDGQIFLFHYFHFCSEFFFFFLAAMLSFLRPRFSRL
jgi:hypothetical protein